MLPLKGQVVDVGGDSRNHWQMCTEMGKRRRAANTVCFIEPVTLDSCSPVPPRASEWWSRSHTSVLAYLRVRELGYSFTDSHRVTE